MSRTNHYRICKDCTAEVLCKWHGWQWSHYYHRWHHDGYQHKPARLIDGRRPWVRKQGWPDYAVGSSHNPPPRWWWHEQHAKVRQIHKQMMIHDDDPALPAEKKLIDLWGWY